METEVLVQLVTSLGLPTALVVYYIWDKTKLSTRLMDEAKERERELIEANKQCSSSLDKVADTIANTNEVNKELSETNRMLVNEMTSKLNSVDAKVDKVLDQVSK